MAGGLASVSYVGEVEVAWWVVCFFVCWLLVLPGVRVYVSCLAAAAWLHDGRMWAWLLCCLVGGHVAVGCLCWAV